MSIFISTSKDKDVDAKFAGDGQVVFEIKVPKGKGIDVNKASGSKSIHPDEKEVAIVGRIEPENISRKLSSGRRIYSAADGAPTISKIAVH